jgi:hypothetical protein
LRKGYLQFLYWHSSESYKSYGYSVNFISHLFNQVVKWKTNKNTAIPKSNINMVERGRIYTPLHTYTWPLSYKWHTQHYLFCFNMYMYILLHISDIHKTTFFCFNMYMYILLHISDIQKTTYFYLNCIVF